jgi:hypothetical protein
MTFQPGQSGNPAGRAVGSRNKKTIAMEEAFLAQAEALVQNVVDRAMRGEPAAMRLCMERVLPVGRGRPLPIDLPTIRSAEDAQAAAAVIAGALKEGAISAREAVDLLRVVEGFTRLAGAIEIIKKIARAEVAKAAATLGMEHFFAGSPGRPEDRGRTTEDGDQMADFGDGDGDYADAGDDGANDNAAFPGTGALRGAANGGAAPVNISENTSAAPDGDAAGRGRIGVKPAE